MRKSILLLLLLLSFMLFTSSAFAVATFNFNDGTNQGWSYEVFVNGASQVAGPTGWSDRNNYPSSMLADPMDGLNGSANVFTPSYAPPAGAYTILQFQSPDLSLDSDWQNLLSYSAQILPSFQGNDTYWANTVLHVLDQGGVDRYFTNEAPASMLTTGDWNLELADVGAMLATASTPITSYITQEVLFNIWIDPVLDVELVFSLDDVAALNASDGNGNGGPAPVPEPATVLLLGCGLAGLAWCNRKRKKA